MNLNVYYKNYASANNNNNKLRFRKNLNEKDLSCTKPNLHSVLLYMEVHKVCDM